MAGVSHYRTLGVEPSASPDEIRAAYLALMKRYHPDARRAEAAGTAQELNRAYAVLKDKVRRAEHDNELGLRTRAALPPGPRPLPAAQHFPQTPPRRRPRKGRAAALSALSLALGALLGVLIAAPFEPGSRSLAEAAPAEPEVPQPPIDGAIVADSGADAEIVFLHGEPRDAVLFSRSCYEELRQMPTLKLLDRCVAFDLASSRWLAITKRERQTGFFSVAAMKERHASAFKRLGFRGKAAEERKGRLDQLALTDIALRLNRP